jgi:type VI protein secretion system component Hcp
MARRERTGEKMKRLAARVVLRTTLGLALLAPGAAFAEVYVQLGNIIGDSRDARYPAQIVAHSFAWEVASPTSAVTSTGTFSGSRPTVGPFTLLKSFDRASIPLQFATVSGTRFASAIVTIVREGGNREVLAVYRLTDVAVSSVKLAGEQGQAPAEQVDLGFGRITATYYVYNASGMPAGSITKSY